MNTRGQLNSKAVGVLSLRPSGTGMPYLPRHFLKRWAYLDQQSQYTFSSSPPLGSPHVLSAFPCLCPRRRPLEAEGLTSLLSGFSLWVAPADWKAGGETGRRPGSAPSLPCPSSGNVGFPKAAAPAWLHQLIPSPWPLQAGMTRLLMAASPRVLHLPRLVPVTPPTRAWMPCFEYFHGELPFPSFMFYRYQ